MKLGKNLSLGGGSDHVGLMREYSIQLHMGFKFSNSYHILHLFSLKHNASIFLEKFKETDWENNNTKFSKPKKIQKKPLS